MPGLYGENSALQPFLLPPGPVRESIGSPRGTGPKEARMRLRPHLFVMSVMILLAAAAVPVAAQTSPDAGALHGGLYRLSTETSFEEGCFAPCLCPIRIASGVLGTFRMTEAAPDPLFQIFDVTEVNWIVPGTEDRVTGSGTYRIGGEFARMH